MILDTFTIPVSPPFRLDLTAWALRRRAKNAIDRWDGRQYGRVLIAGNTAIHVLMEQNTEVELSVTLRSERSGDPARQEVETSLQKMFSVDTDLAAFYQLAEGDAHLRSLAQRFKGVRPPRFPTIFEGLANSIACQQVSLDAGLSLLNKLAENYGLRFSDGDETYYAFPRPEDLYQIAADDIKKLGFSYQKARAITELSVNIVDQKLTLSGLDALSNEEILNILVQNRGIGRWSAEYALLRGFGRIDVLPGDDVGAQKNLMELMGLEARPNYDQIQALTQRWQPYAGFVYFHLLLDKLQLKGLL